MTQIAGTRMVLDRTPPAHFGAGVLRFNLPACQERLAAVAFGVVAADALDDEVLANTPRPPAGADIRAILTGALDGTGQVPAAAPPTRPSGPGPAGG